MQQLVQEPRWWQQETAGTAIKGAIDPVAWKTLGAKLGKVQRDQERLLDRYDTLDALARQLRLKIAARRGQGGRSAAARHVTSTGISDSLDSDSESGMFLLGRAC
nr:uncharacterized protein LOC109756748 isoform X5 [Aegilops tauschii subsp. strangulata]